MAAGDFAQVILQVGDHVGLSGCTADAQGQIWAVPEREPVLLPLRITGNRPGLGGEPVPLQGVPPGLDLEALAWMGNDRFALGTEGKGVDREGDVILLVRVEDGRARVTEKLSIPYGRWGLKVQSNRGIEGICHAAGRLVAITEFASERTGDRFATVLRYDLPSKAWVRFRLRLTTDSGLPSALACRPAQDGLALEVLAVERHFAVSRILSFRLPLEGEGGELRPVVLVDLAPFITLSTNLEGLAWLETGELVLISDNHWGRITGPTLGILLKVRPAE